jgi:transposase
MLIVETIARIRREHFIKGKTIKEIARDLKVSRNTVRKVLRSGETSFEYERVVQPRPKLGRWAAELDGLLAGNAAKAAREQLTLIRIFEELRGRGYDGGYDAVRRYARRWSKERGQSTAAAYVPLSFAPGEAYQFDWSHEVVLLNGVTVIVKAAHVRLCHSRMLFVRGYPRETQEMVFDAHDRAFALFKGTCGRGIYDNMKTAVETIFVGKGRLYNRRFMQMCSHYLVDPVACTPASGWEKGQVENQVGLVRERFFTPRLRFKTLDELNAWLLDKCIAYAKAHRHPELPEQTVWEVFEAERPKLVPYAGRFDGFHAVPASVSKTCLVRFDNNKYSVTASAVGRPVEVHAYADRIVIRQDGRIVAEHPRSFGRGETTYDPWHYVPVLARKPGALRNGAPFKDWVLPAAIERVRRKLASADDGNRQMVDILNAVRKDPLFPHQRRGLDFSTVFAGFTGGDEGAFREQRTGKSRRGQFLAGHAIDPALHQRAAFARYALEPRPVDLDEAAPVGPDGPRCAKLAHRQGHRRPPHPEQLGKCLLRQRKHVVGNAVVNLQQPPRHAAFHPMQRVAGGHVLELQQQGAGVDLHHVPDGCAPRTGEPEEASAGTGSDAASGNSDGQMGLAGTGIHVLPLGIGTNKWRRADLGAVLEILPSPP